MMRRRASSAPRVRASRHGRHGREDRSPVVRPPLPAQETREERFDFIVGTAAEFLRSAWPELRDVAFEVAAMPPAPDADGIPRWTVSTGDRRIVLYRLPIERLGSLHREDDLHRRMAIESCVFRAAAEYLDRDPWDLGPERFRYF
ncbi:metallopeptidase family protein [Microbacterium hominis]|uniref:metallopeptidase family protein n=1 Tax=Microbacterium TaxID=33882 RepID=UPI00168A7162|nr:MULTISPECIES: metallopeptidase family protein [Microbacterium]QOC26160.1 metallopeptidase family protein [Microbacterium hominis]QOC30125.1 metallopeptidase family protein [Microbacterium hominis]QRY41686.1 metallopeptidase family protein [Microbacterium hominis]QYF97534.1 metallopeptidase family protein [Microbacterium sp. PAMC21962]